MKALLSAALLALASFAHAGEIVTAPAGELLKSVAEAPQANDQLNVDMRIRKIGPRDTDWLPMAAVTASAEGKGGDADKSSFTVFLTQEKGRRDLTLGHKYVEDGKVVFQKSIYYGVPVHAWVTVQMTLREDGTLLVDVPHLKLHHEYTTTLKTLYSGNGASGVSAEFRRGSRPLTPDVRAKPLAKADGAAKPAQAAPAASAGRPAKAGASGKAAGGSNAAGAPGAANAASAAKSANAAGAATTSNAAGAANASGASGAATSANVAGTATGAAQ